MGKVWPVIDRALSEAPMRPSRSPLDMPASNARGPGTCCLPGRRESPWERETRRGVIGTRKVHQGERRGPAQVASGALFVVNGSTSREGCAASR